MRKSVLKRVKITKTGKMLRRKAGHNHFNAKASRNTQMRRNKTTNFSKADEGNIRAHMQ